MVWETGPIKPSWERSIIYKQEYILCDQSDALQESIRRRVRDIVDMQNKAVEEEFFRILKERS